MCTRMNYFDLDFTWNVESLIIFRDRSAHITGVFSPYPFSVTKRKGVMITSARVNGCTS